MRLEVCLVLDVGETLVRVLHCVLGSQGICNACWKVAVDSKCCLRLLPGVRFRIGSVGTAFWNRHSELSNDLV